ncbi:MAG: FMN-binding negative transcriptional regulator [Thermoplasmata archaeon]|jgi:transcriptional regulator|nr:FMN-binding negative transcriptional regulator [Thermoplasmata archaeon]
MIIRPSDRALTDDEWRTLLLEQDFGTLIAPGAGREFPIVSPSHFAFDGKETVVLHFVRDNPVWAALVERPVAILSVIGEYAYIPSYVNAGEEAPEEWGVPTSYYATVQLRCGTAIVDDPAELARLLTDLMAHFQPEGRHEPIEAGDNPYAQQFGAIRGLRLTIRDVRAKFKFGGNRPRAHQLAVAEALRTRGAPRDAEVRAHVLRRLRGSDSSPNSSETPPSRGP